MNVYDEVVNLVKSVGPNKEIAHTSLSIAIEQAANGIIITDIAGTIQYVNPAFTAMTGYSAAEAVGNSTRMLNSGKHSKEFYTNLWATIQSGQVWQGELVNRR